MEPALVQADFQNVVTRRCGKYDGGRQFTLKEETIFLQLNQQWTSKVRFNAMLLHKETNAFFTNRTYDVC